MTRYNSKGPAEIVCFGMVTPAVVLIVEDFPEHNTGAVVQQIADFISDDAAIVACLLRGWDVHSGLIGSALGNDRRGRRVVRELRKLGVLARVPLSRHLHTPYEVNISDQSGARTYFWQRERKLLSTLEHADLSLLNGARMLYLDWYDGDYILRAMEAADRQGIPIFLNLEFGHQDPQLLKRYASRAAVCQAITDPAQHAGDARRIARKLLKAGAQTALVTLAGKGCLAMEDGQVLRVRAPSVPVVDGCGAGAAFSAGFLYGSLQGWDLEQKVRFATAAASLKVSLVGIQTPALEQVERLAAELRVERAS